MDLELAYGAIKAWFKDIDWLANAIGILTPLVALGLLAYRLRARFFGPSSFTAIATSRIAPAWGLDAAKAVSEIAIVDDKPEDFPIPELRKAAYNIRVYKQVSQNDIPRLARYDVVFLDIHGIVRDDIETGGLKVIAQLRALNESQKICAVSQKTFDPTATAFFKQADDVKKKPMTAQECVDTIDLFSREKLDPSRLARQIDHAISHLSVWKRRGLLVSLQKFALSSLSPYDYHGFDDVLGPKDLGHRLAVIDFIRVLRHATR